jgi:hypothetical protein
LDEYARHVPVYGVASLIDSKRQTDHLELKSSWDSTDKDSGEKRSEAKYSEWPISPVLP